MTWQLTRDRMVADLELANRASSTIAKYVLVVDRLAAHAGRDSTELGEREIREFLLKVRERGIGPSSLRIHVAAVKFLFTTTLRRPEVVAPIPYPRVPRPLPVVLSGTEVEQLL